MQMIQDGQYANAPEKPLRMTGTAESCRVSVAVMQKYGISFLGNNITCGHTTCEYLLTCHLNFNFIPYVILQKARDLVFQLIEQKELEVSVLFLIIMFAQVFLIIFK